MSIFTTYPQCFTLIIHHNSLYLLVINLTTITTLHVLKERKHDLPCHSPSRGLPPFHPIALYDIEYLIGSVH